MLPVSDILRLFRTPRRPHLLALEPRMMFDAAAAVTIASAVIAFPIAYYAARYARGRGKALFYLGVMLPLWSSYLVKIYAWKLILAKEGILTWFFTRLGLSGLIDGVLSLPSIGGPSRPVVFTHGQVNSSPAGGVKSMAGVVIAGVLALG